MATLTGCESCVESASEREGCSTVLGIKAELGGCLLSVQCEGQVYVFHEQDHGDGQAMGVPLVLERRGHGI